MKYFQKQMSKILNRLQAILSFNAKLSPEAQVDHSVKDLSNFVYLWNASFNKAAIETGKKINFSEYFEFGSSLKLILNLSGKPDAIFENEAFQTKILVYNILIKNKPVKFELHFQEERLFFLNYTYLQITDIEKDLLIRSVLEKYHINTQDMPQDISQSILIDQDGNGILISDKETFSVNYLAPNSKVKSLTQSYVFENKEAI